MHRTLQHISLSVIPALLLASQVASQEPAIEPDPAIVQASQTTHHLEELLRDLKELSERVRVAHAHAQQAATKAQSEFKDAEESEHPAKDTAKRLRDTADQSKNALSALEEALAKSRQSIKVATSKSAKLATSKLGAALAAQHAALKAAAKKRKNPDAIKAYKNIEKALTKGILKSSSEANRLRAFAMYQRANCLVRAYTHSASSGRAHNEIKLTQASKLYNDIVDVMKSAPPYAGEWGSSLAASALRRLVGIQGAFYERYMRLKKTSRYPKRFEDKAKTCHLTALRHYEELGRNHADEWTADRQNRVVDATHTDIQSMFSGR